MTFTKEKLSELKNQYNVAIENNLEVFIFDGSELLVSYAKYLIQYLETQLK